MVADGRGATGPPKPVSDGPLGNRSAKCHDRRMAASVAELSSLATALEDLTRRVTAHADAASHAKDEDMAKELFAIERALMGASRRLTRLTTALRRP